MTKEDKKFIFVFVVVYAMFFLAIIIGCKNKVVVKEEYVQNLEEQINELQNKVYQQYELIDALKQNY